MHERAIQPLVQHRQNAAHKQRESSREKEGEDMKILFAKLKKGFFAKKAQGIIEKETKYLFTIRTLGIGNIINIKKQEIEYYRIESPPPAFTELIY